MAAAVGYNRLIMCPQVTLAEQLTKALEDCSQAVVSAYLHGSHVRGTSHAESDVDLGLLLDYEAHPGRMERDAARIALIGDLQMALGRNDIDVVILNDAPPTLARHVVLDGIRVFCRDEGTDHDFRRNVQLRAADLAPFLRRTRRVKLEAIRR